MHRTMGWDTPFLSRLQTKYLLTINELNYWSDNLQSNNVPYDYKATQWISAIWRYVMQSQVRPVQLEWDQHPLVRLLNTNIIPRKRYSLSIVKILSGGTLMHVLSLMPIKYDAIRSWQKQFLCTTLHRTKYDSSTLLFMPIERTEKHTSRFRWSLNCHYTSCQPKHHNFQTQYAHIYAHVLLRNIHAVSLIGEYLVFVRSTASRIHLFIWTASITHDFLYERIGGSSGKTIHKLWRTLWNTPACLNTGWYCYRSILTASLLHLSWRLLPNRYHHRPELQSYISLKLSNVMDWGTPEMPSM